MPQLFSALRVLGRHTVMKSALATVRCSPSTSVTDAADYYAGKTFRIIVPFGPGGGYDLHARIMAQRLGTYLPGQPTVVVENMPGAGGLVAARYMAHRAGPDGLTIGMFNGGLVLQHLVRHNETDSFSVDVNRFVVVGSPTPGVSVCIFPADSRFRHVQTWLGSETPPKIGMTGSQRAGLTQRPSFCPLRWDFRFGPSGATREAPRFGRLSTPERSTAPASIMRSSR